MQRTETSPNFAEIHSEFFLSREPFHHSFVSFATEVVLKVIDCLEVDYDEVESVECRSDVREVKMNILKL